MSTSPYSLVGMVVQGTNLSTLADVQAIYGSNTTWQLISSVSLASENIVGNGYTLGLTEGNTLGGMRARGDNVAPSLYGEPVGSTNITGTLLNTLVSSQILFKYILGKGQHDEFSKHNQNNRERNGV